jgi:hypothetical protein
MVGDPLYGRDARTPPSEEWGGICYAPSACDAALPDDWELEPLNKVGRDLAPRAREWLRSLRHLAVDAVPIEVEQPNNRVELRYFDEERRSEVLRGGVPAWTWIGLAPLVRDLDAVYVNFISGFEMDLATAKLLRQHYRGPLYADLHSLLLGVDETGRRIPQPMSNVDEWCRCFDFIQVNEDELDLIANDGFALAVTALDAGVRSLVVTLGARGHVYFLAPGFNNLSDLRLQSDVGGAIRTARVPAAPLDRERGVDPTGCGDVWGATYFSRLAAGDAFDDAMRSASHAATQNAVHRGATGLAAFLRGELSRT